MQNYLIILLGWALGQFLFITVQAAIIHKSSKYEHTFGQAFKVYFSKDVGPFITGISIMLIALFILPDLIANAQTAPEDLPMHGKYVGIVLKYLRLFSIGLGLISQFVGFLLVSKSSKWINKQGGDIVVDPENAKLKQ